MTGNRTVTALVMALQLKLGLTADGAWGNMTTNACPTITSSTKDSTLLRIVQGGFICKGYDPSGFDGIIGSGLIRCINTFKNIIGYNFWIDISCRCCRGNIAGNSRITTGRYCYKQYEYGIAGTCQPERGNKSIRIHFTAY